MSTAVLMITIAVSILAWMDPRLFTALLFEPFVIRGRREYHRFLTHAFVHSDVYHLAVNMFVLSWAGARVQQLFGLIKGGDGGPYFLMLYIGGIVFSSLIGFKRHEHDPNYRAVGASGAVSAVLFSFILMMPTARMGLLFIPIPIPAFLMGGLYLAYEYYMDRRGGTGIAHDAHFAGAVFGLLFTAWLDPDLVLHLGHLQQIMP